MSVDKEKGGGVVSEDEQENGLGKEEIVIRKGRAVDLYNERETRGC